MRAALLLLLSVISLGACTHDWDRYDVVEDNDDGGGSGVGAGGVGAGGVGGAENAEACLEVCDAHSDCGFPATNCAGCGAAIANCMGEDVTRVGECAQSLRVLCDESIYENCLPACY